MSNESQGSDKGHTNRGKGGSYGKPSGKGKGGFGARRSSGFKGKGCSNASGKPFKGSDKPRGNRDDRSKDGARGEKRYDKKDGSSFEKKRYNKQDGKPRGEKRFGNKGGKNSRFGDSRGRDGRFNKKDGKRFDARDAGKKGAPKSPRFDKKHDYSDSPRFSQQDAEAKLVESPISDAPNAQDALNPIAGVAVDRAVEGAQAAADSAPSREASHETSEGKRDRNARPGRSARGPRQRSERPQRFERPRLSPGRAAACAIGRVVRERNAYTAEVTPAVLARFEGISAEDAAFATKIARGVTATVGTLDEFIDRNMRNPDDIRDVVRDAMRVSAYELLYLDKASYAAVDQGVELVRSVEPNAAGLANAILRKMAVSAKSFPYGNPNLSLPVLARSHAFPLWMAKRLMNEMGLNQATSFMEACNSDAPVFIAVNDIKASVEEVEDVFDQAGTLLSGADDVPGCFLVKDARALRKPAVRALFEEGKVSVSDQAAQAIALLACPADAPASMLEIGCGRGTKTILMQSNAHRLYGSTVPMTSVDVHDFKIDVLGKRCEQYGIDTVTPLVADGCALSETLSGQSFDAVFVDAPCSGVGTLRRHPEIRWRLTEEDIESMAQTGLQLLTEASKLVSANGTLTYATCTVFQEENERVVERFLACEEGALFELEKTMRTSLSAQGSDAHYAVRLSRRG